MALQIFMTGGSGYVGSAVLRALRERGHRVHALVHREPLARTDQRVTSFIGGLFDSASLDRGMAGCDAAIHLVGIIAEDPAAGATFERIHHQGTRAVVDAARRNGVERFIQMSAAGARGDAPTPYHLTKFAAEQVVRNSGLKWSIFRPSLIHGPGGEFIEMEIALARRRKFPYLAMPYFGAGPLGLGGGGLLQPVYLPEVARAFVDALDVPASVGKIYELGGTQRVSWPELHRKIAVAATGAARATLPIPVWLALGLTRIVPAAWLPFSRDQVMLSQEDNVTDVAAFVRDFGWRPRGLDPTLAEYLPPP